MIKRDYDVAKRLIRKYIFQKSQNVLILLL